jgi:RNA polymerase sigma factor (TIGR02999 family)
VAPGEERGGEKDVSRILRRVSEGTQSPAQELLPLVYDELRRLARRQMGAERPGQTLQPTSLVHEAFLRLVGEGDPGWENRRHFFAAAATAMRRILVERARAKASRKRGGGRERVGLDLDDFALEDRSERLLALDEALDRLERRDPPMARLVQLRFFAGLSAEETAHALEISVRTVHRDWAVARAWLRVEIERDPSSAGRG